MTLSTELEDSMESPTGPETAENNIQLAALLSTEGARQSLEVNIESVDDALRQREEQIEVMRACVEMRLQSMLKGDPLVGLRQQVHALRDCHPDPVKATSDSDAASSITTKLTYNEDDEDDDNDDGGDDEILQLSRQGHSRVFPLSNSWMRQVDDESELIIPNSARLDSIMETLAKDTSLTSHARRTPRSVARALARGSTAIMHARHTFSI
jgi:hypothetical protein